MLGRELVDCVLGRLICVERLQICRCKSDSSEVWLDHVLGANHPDRNPTGWAAAVLNHRYYEVYAHDSWLFVESVAGAK